MPTAKNIAGREFGRLTAIKPYRKINGRWQWICICKCGVRCLLAVGTLTTGHTKSCGCLWHDQKHKSKNRTHGQTATLTYRRWAEMCTRCNNKNSTTYTQYGNKGIKICKRWKNYLPFLSDMGKCPSKYFTLDRINNSKGYYKSNCRWATRREQVLNRSMTIWFRKNGKRQCLKDWAKELKIPYKQLSAKLKKVPNKRKFFDSLF